MESGNLNLLEPSEPLQACNGTALCGLEKKVVPSYILLIMRNVQLHFILLFYP